MPEQNNTVRKSQDIEQIAESTVICCQNGGCGEMDCEMAVLKAIGDAYDDGWNARSEENAELKRQLEHYKLNHFDHFCQICNNIGRAEEPKK